MNKKCVPREATGHTVYLYIPPDIRHRIYEQIFLVPVKKL